MMSFLQSTGLAAACVLLLTAPVSAQKVPAHRLRPDHYYLNGQPSSKAVVSQVDPRRIASVNVLKGQQAAEYTHDPQAKGAVLVTTKARK